MSDEIRRPEFEIYTRATDHRLDRLEKELDEKVASHQADMLRLAQQRDDDIKAGAEALKQAFREAAEKAQKRAEWTWQRAAVVVAAMGLLVTTWYEILSHR